MVMRGSSRDVADTIPPVLASPPPYYIAPNASLVFTFSEPIKLGSGTLVLIANGQRSSYEIAGNPGMRVDDSILTFDPPADLAANTEYQVWITAGAILDLSGNPLVHPNVGGYEYALTETFRTDIATAPVNTTGTAGNDTIHGSNAADRIAGGGGRDGLYGHDGDDTIDGGDEPPDTSGNVLNRWGDTILGGAGNDVMHGNGGQDNLNGGAGDDRLYGDADGDWLFGGAGNDLLDGGEGDDLLSDEAGDNILLGGAGNDSLSTGAGATGRQEGGDGDDALSGYGGVDYFGGTGNDQIILTLTGANAPHSTIEGGAGDDRIVFEFDRPGRVDAGASGGSGVDTYVVQGAMAAAGTGLVTITDFTPGPGGDRIDLSALLGPDYAGNPFKDGLLRLVHSPAFLTLIELRVEGAPGGYVTFMALASVVPPSLTRENFVGGIDPTGRDDGVTLDGTASSDLLTGTPYADTVRGNGGDDRLVGNGGNDSLDGGAGADTLNGGNGTDLARYAGNRSDYAFLRNQDGFTLTGLRGAASDGRDTLADVERVAFADAHIAFDTDGVAGQAFRLYRAAFDRAPDLGGIGFYIAMMDKGVSLLDVAGSFVASDEFQSLYGSAPTTEELVTRMYTNVLHRAPDPTGYAFWVDVLNAQRASVAEVLAAFSEGPENQEATAELVAQGIAYTPYG